MSQNLKSMWSPRLNSLLTPLAVLCLCCVGSFGQDRSITAEWLLDGPKPRAVDRVTSAEIEASIRRGVNFLLADQNSDGSFGSATKTKALNIYAPIPGAHDAFRAAVTSLCISALIESQDRRAEVVEAIEDAEVWLVRNLPDVRRADATAIYNTWCHAYSIQACCDLHTYHAERPKRQPRLIKMIAQQIEMLRRYAGIDGGWGYYDFGAHTQIPNVNPTSFTTATILIALHEAQTLGLAVPENTVRKAIVSLERQQKPDYSYYYSDNGPVQNRPMWSINRPGGSLGRSQACNLALRKWGDASITNRVLETWLHRLFARNLWLDMGRKRPIPHESHFLVAGYFFYYGHFYAACCIEVLPAKEQTPHQQQLAAILMELQEKDGSWWDYPLYNYHQQYGTAFSVMSLSRCRSHSAN